MIARFFFWFGWLGATLIASAISSALNVSTAEAMVLGAGTAAVWSALWYRCGKESR